MARTTLDIDPSVLRELRSRGAHEGKSMGQLASELLARSLAAGGEGGERSELGWISRDLGSARVDLEDTEAVRAILDERS